MKLIVSIAFETVKMSWLFEGMQEWWTQQQDSRRQTLTQKHSALLLGCRKKTPRKITKTDHTNKLNRQASWQTEHAV